MLLLYGTMLFYRHMHLNIEIFLSPLLFCIFYYWFFAYIILKPCHELRKQVRDVNISKTLYRISNIFKEHKTVTLLQRISKQNYTNKKLQKQIKLFTVQLLHHPLDFNMFGFFVLDYTGLYLLVSIVCGFSIVMIQFEFDEQLHR